METTFLVLDDLAAAVVEIHDRFQVAALDMSVNATVRHRLHEGFAVPTVLRYEFDVPDGQQCVVLAPVGISRLANPA